MDVRRAAVVVAGVVLLAGCGGAPTPQPREVLPPISADQVRQEDLEAALLTADDLPWGWRPGEDGEGSGGFVVSDCFSIGPIIEQHEQASAYVVLESVYDVAVVSEYLMTAADAPGFLAAVRDQFARCQPWSGDWPDLDATIRYVPEPLELSSAAGEYFAFRWSLSGIPQFGLGRADFLVARSGDLVQMVTFMSFGPDDRAWLRDAIIEQAERKLRRLGG